MTPGQYRAKWQTAAIISDGGRRLCHLEIEARQGYRPWQEGGSLVADEQEGWAAEEGLGSKFSDDS
jgi:hypothetical protein